MIGLDPTGVNFRRVHETKRISARSAKYVEVIHTSGLLGFPEPIGQIDFFVNGGRSQPCFSMSMPDCSHPRSLDYYMEAMFNNKSFIGIQCSNYNDFKDSKCENGDKVNMAADYDFRNPYKRGKYFLFTRNNSPFGLGDQGIRSKRQQKSRTSTGDDFTPLKFSMKLISYFALTFGSEKISQNQSDFKKNTIELIDRVDRLNLIVT